MFGGRGPLTGGVGGEEPWVLTPVEDVVGAGRDEAPFRILRVVVDDLGLDERHLLRRIGQPADAAYAVWFLASRYADYITGEILHVDGGFKME